MANIIDGLPGHSHLGQAWADDETAVSQAQAPARWRPTTRHHDETAVILTAIQAGIENLVAVQADKYKPVYILPPLTAHDRVAARVAREQYEHLSRKLFGPTNP